MTNSDKRPPPDERPVWLTFGEVGAVGIEMGLAVGLSTWFGSWLDERYDTKPIFLYVFLVIGIGAAFKGLHRVAKRVAAQEAANEESEAAPKIEARPERDFARLDDSRDSTEERDSSPGQGADR